MLRNPAPLRCRPVLKSRGVGEYGHVGSGVKTARGPISWLSAVTTAATHGDNLSLLLIRTTIPSHVTSTRTSVVSGVIHWGDYGFSSSSRWACSTGAVATGLSAVTIRTAKRHVGPNLVISDLVLPSTSRLYGRTASGFCRSRSGNVGTPQSLDPMRGANVFVSDDEGAHWRYRGGVIFKDSCFNEHSIVELGDGRLWMLSRCQKEITLRLPDDGGVTWQPQRTAFPHVNSKCTVRRLQSGNILLVRHGTDMTLERLSAVIWRHFRQQTKARPGRENCSLMDGQRCPIRI